MKFKRKDVIKTDGKYFECICADARVCVFGEITKWDESEMRTSYEKMFVIDQIHQENFIYELVKHHAVRVVPDSDGAL